MKLLYCLLINLIVLTGITYGQFENLDIGARPIGMGGAFTSIANNTNAIYFNPSGISQLIFREFSIFYSPAPYGLSELKHGAFSYVEPTKYGAFGLSGKTYGFELYKEFTGTLTYANNYKRKVYYGANFNYYNLKIERYGSASTFGIDIGMLAYLTDFMRFGFTAANLNRPSIGQNKDKLPQIYRAGLSFQLRKDLNVALDVEKDTRYTVSFKSGFEYNILDMLDVRAGVSSEPTKFSAGIGFSYSLFQIDYGFYNHPDLGLTHQGSVIINFGGAKGRKMMRESLKSAYGEITDTLILKKVKVKKMEPGQWVNINKADEKSLQSIPYVSEKMAKDIIMYREKIGLFTSHDELLKIKGISEKKLEKMKPYIKFLDF